MSNETAVDATSLVDKLMDYEEGKLSDLETIQLFAKLVKSGIVWRLQGAYGRTAMKLIETGKIGLKGEVLDENIRE